MEKKLAAISRINEGQSLRSVGRGLGVDESTVRGWKRNQEKLESFKSTKKDVRNYRRLGSGKRAAFPELEAKLFTWVHDQNAKGSQVKDKCIQARAAEIKEELLLELANYDDEQNLVRLKNLQEFGVSMSWCSRFKNRFDLTTKK